MAQAKNKKNKGKMDINPVIAGATFAAVGAGVAVAANVAMNNKATRKKVDSVVKTVKKQASEYVDIMKADNLKEGRKALGKTAATVKNQLQMKAGQNVSGKTSAKSSGKKSARASAQA